MVALTTAGKRAATRVVTRVTTRVPQAPFPPLRRGAGTG